MKKAFRCTRQIYCAALFATLLFFPCACVKQSVQEVHVQADITTNNSAQGQQASEVSGMQPDDDASKKTDAPLSFESVEIVPSQSELQSGGVLNENLRFLESKQYGLVAASYYATVPGIDVWDARLALFGEEGVKKAVSIEVPDNLDFKPFRADPNPSETYLLICKYDSDAPTYYLYDGTILHEISVLNDRAFGTVEPSHVRWHSDDELIYDIENLETRKYTTYLYQIQTQKETILLADYDPFPFRAADTVKNRFLLIQDTYALRVERGGGVFLRLLPNGDEIKIPNLCTPDETYFHITQLGPHRALYYSADESGRYTTLAFIECRSGSCVKLKRIASDNMNEQAIMLLNENTVAIPAVAGTAGGGEQNYLFVYSVCDIISSLPDTVLK